MVNTVYFRFKLTNRQTIAQNTYELWFELVQKSDNNNEAGAENTQNSTHPNIFSFRPGQYIWLILDGLRQDDPKGNRRAFSISSGSYEKNRFSIVFRGSDSGYKQTLIQLEIGWEVSVTLPMGSSFDAISLSSAGSQNENSALCYIAGGVGIAPFLSILKTQAYEQVTPKHQVLVLLHRNETTAFYREELRQLCQQTNTQLIEQIDNYTLTTLSQLERFHDFHFFISGSQKMVQNSYTSLLALGISENLMHFEQFYPVQKNSIRRFFETTNQTSQENKDNQYKMLVDSASNHLIITDENGFIVYANQAAQNTTGFSFAEMQGNTPRLWGGQMQAVFYTKMWQTLKVDKKPFVGEIVNQRKNGEQYTAVGRITPILENNEVTGFVASEEDISERVAAEHKLKDSELKYRNLVEKIKDTYFFFRRNTTGQITYISPSVSTVLGYSAQELQKHITELPFTDNPINKNISERYAKGAEVYNRNTYEAEVLGKEGNILSLEFTETPEIDVYGNIIAIDGIVKDSTKEKQVDRMKTEFISLASHQLRTPLSAINWYLELLTDGTSGKLNEEQLKFVEQAHAGARRMVELVNALLNVARIEAGSFMIDPKPTNLVQLTRSVLDELKPLSDTKKLKIELHKENFPEILLDPDLIRIVIHNIITNAIKYTPVSGSINLNINSVAANTDLGLFMDTPIKVTQESILFSVTDTGLGIPQAEQSKIFTKLYRAQNVTRTDIEGTGLGLYIIRQIIKEASGQLWFESKENEGSTFYILLPETGMIKREGQKKLS